MREPTLEQLARLRAQAVEEARRALSAAERTRDARATVLAEAQALDRARARDLDQARARFAAASTVSALHWESLVVERALALRGVARTAVLRATQQHADAERAVTTRTEAVRTSELARRVVTRTLARRAQGVTLRTERRLEDELDAIVRTRTNSP